jgi:hypothetical protein
MTTHGCGHCGKKFESHSDLSDHISECTVIKCLVCDTEFETHSGKMNHRPCPDSEPVEDPEAEFREKRRERKKRREFERRVRKRNTLY